MTRLADAIIVGGGIHGCSTALHLCLAGMKPVLIEKDYAGRHASGVNAGGVRQLARHIPEIPLSIRSMGIWEKIEELVDDDCSFESHGQVLVAENDTELATCRARVAELNALGFTQEELIDAAELRRLVPAVAETCPGGVVSRRDGAANPAQTTTPVRGKAEQVGATSLEGGGAVAAPPRGGDGPGRDRSADADDHLARAALHRPRSDPARAQALLQAIQERHCADRRRTSGDAVPGAQRDGAGLEEPRGQRAHRVRAVSCHA